MLDLTKELPLIEPNNSGLTVHDKITLAEFLTALGLSQDSNGNVVAASGKGIVLSNVATGNAAADTVVIGAKDRSAANTIVTIKTEGTGIRAVGTVAASVGALVFEINGVLAYVPYSATPPS